jgi:hypothetical protein
MRNEMNEKFVMPRKDVERLIEENLADAKRYRENGNDTMANWCEGRASMAKMLLDVWGLL